MSIYKKTASYDIIVVGGGMAGMCAAISAARGGAKTAIVQNRSVFGGNASSEIQLNRYECISAAQTAIRPNPI